MKWRTRNPHRVPEFPKSLSTSPFCPGMDLYVLSALAMRPVSRRHLQIVCSSEGSTVRRIDTTARRLALRSSIDSASVTEGPIASRRLLPRPYSCESTSRARAKGLNCNKKPSFRIFRFRWAVRLFSESSLLYQPNLCPTADAAAAHTLDPSSRPDAPPARNSPSCSALSGTLSDRGHSPLP